MNIRMLSAAALLTLTGAAHAQSYEVGQTDKKFTQEHLDIKVGDTVKFTNNDPFFHNVFSLSDAEMFDLGSYPQGESRDVQFNTAGEIEVECAIHPEMRMIINVQE